MHTLPIIAKSRRRPRANCTELQLSKWVRSSIAFINACSGCFKPSIETLRISTPCEAKACHTTLLEGNSSAGITILSPAVKCKPWAINDKPSEVFFKIAISSVDSALTNSANFCFNFCSVCIQCR